MHAETLNRVSRNSTLGRTLLAAPAMGVVLVCAVFLIWKFPFRRDAVVSRLKTVTGANVEMASFRRTWLPPGFSAHGVRLWNPNGVLTIATITLKGSYTGLLQSPKAIPEIQASGLRLVIAAQRNPLLQGSDSDGGLVVGRIGLENAELDLQPKTPGEPALAFLIHALTLEQVGPGRQTTYRVALHNPRPSGDIRSEGQFGPVNTRPLRETPVSGAFTFEQADLTVRRAIAATLNASGRFQGRLGAIECTGTADVPRFQVFGSSHAVHIAARFNATVDATTGNAALQEVVAHFNGTTVAASGTVGPTPERPGKTVTLNAAIRDGRVEDLLLLFTANSRAAMTGPIRLTGKFTVPPGPPGFLTRLKMNGQFEIARGQFTNPNTQARINQLSESAAGEPKGQQANDPTLVPLDIRAAVSDRDGVACLPDIIFEAPGMRGRLGGTFTLRNRDLDLNGTLATTGKLSDTTTGVKTLMLKVLGPLWPRRASVQYIPFHVGGKASHPVFRLKLRNSGTGTEETSGSAASPM